MVVVVSDWLVHAVGNWPVTLGISVVILAFLLWFLMPFAVFGVKRRLDKLTTLMEEVVRLLKENQSCRQSACTKDQETPRTDS